ncbi:site-specific integrase [Streptomyces sp. NPDC050164]|uniref:site-specific integrase n=1 Tax=Streptomyces sp. NPDC050164 TaxID=3365605 RepID=UPI0037877602
MAGAGQHQQPQRVAVEAFHGRRREHCVESVEVVLGAEPVPEHLVAGVEGELFYRPRRCGGLLPLLRDLARRQHCAEDLVEIPWLGPASIDCAVDRGPLIPFGAGAEHPPGDGVAHHLADPFPVEQVWVELRDGSAEDGEAVRRVVERLVARSVVRCRPDGIGLLGDRLLDVAEKPAHVVLDVVGGAVHELFGGSHDRLGSGLRAGELFGLQVRHIDFLRRTVKVEQQVQRAYPGVVVCPPKTKRSYRTVPVPQSVIDALAAHLKAYPAGPDDFVFAGPVNADHFADNVWRPAVKAAGLPTGTRLHGLRHTYASVLIKHGKGPKTVATRLGDTVAVAMAIYAHLFPDEDTRDAVEEFLSEAA